MASRTKARMAFALLILTGALLVIALGTCLPSKGARGKAADLSAGTESDIGTAPERPLPIPNPVPVPETTVPAPLGNPAAPPIHPQKTGIMAIIIDDAGYSLEDLQPFLSYPGPIAIAVLPNLPNSAEAAKRVAAAGKTLLLHLPMEPLNGENPGPGVLKTSDTDAELARQLAAAYASVPGAAGVNNHMGSKATGDARVMSALFSFLKEKNMYFVDSRTTPASVGEEMAQRYGVPFLSRDIFMDNERTAEDITQSIQAGILKAKTRGSAVLIGHVHTPLILTILKEEGQALEESGVGITGLSDIFTEKREQGD